MMHWPILLTGLRGKRILVVNGHPDPRPERFCAALCAAYIKGAVIAGHETRRLDVGTFTETVTEFDRYRDRHRMARGIASIAWSNWIVVVFPLWLDRPPDSVSTLFDEFARTESLEGIQARPADEKKAKIVVTTSLPSFIYRPNNKTGRNDMLPPNLSLPGTHSIDSRIIGSVERLSSEQRRRWLEEMHASGERGA